MYLAIDFGNSLVKTGIYHRDQLLKFESFQKLTTKELGRMLNEFPVKRVIISSVINQSHSVEKFLNKQVPTMRLDSSTRVPFRNKYKTPGTLGSDRIAAITGAGFIFPNKNVLVINAGSCITYDLLDDHKNYYGGNISPGLDMRLKALNTFTERLPLIKKNVTRDLVGKTSATAILTGVVRGAAMEMNGFIAAYKSKYRNMKVILTGGDSFIFETLVESKIFARPHLVLYGLNKILALNDPA